MIIHDRIRWKSNHRLEIIRKPRPGIDEWSPEQGGHVYLRDFGLWVPSYEEFRFTNVITNVGVDYLNDNGFTGLYVLLTDGTPTVDATDTLASHAGWGEVTDYSGDRPSYQNAASSSKTVTNAANKASFTFTDSATVGGAGACDAATGTADVLVAVAAAGADTPVVSTNVALVTLAYTGADDGA